MGGRRDPFEEIEELFEQLNSGFSEMSQEFGGVDGSGIHVDVADAEDEIVVVADVPGFEPEDIDVSVTDRQLRIEAEHSGESEIDEEDAQYYRRERIHRSVSRTVSLPTDVKGEEAAASYENGVLTVELPKADSEDGVDIEVS